MCMLGIGSVAAMGWVHLKNKLESNASQVTTPDDEVAAKARSTVKASVPKPHVSVPGSIQQESRERPRGNVY
jgi:hypothetical protein